MRVVEKKHGSKMLAIYEYIYIYYIYIYMVISNKVTKEMILDFL